MYIRRFRRAMVLMQIFGGQVKKFFRNICNLLKRTIRAYSNVKPDSTEGRLVQQMQDLHDQLQQVFAEGLYEGGDNYRKAEKNTTAEGGVKYSLGQYSEAQKENWKKSNKILVYENDAQLLQFIADSISNKDAANKMYLGTITGDLANRIKVDTGLDFSGKNAVIRAKNVRKIILHDHGNADTEKLRGQIAVTEKDFLAIKDIFGDPDSIKQEPGGYKGKPAATFQKTIGAKKYTMFVVDSGGSLDVFVQTMYIHKQKGSITNVANAKALTSTPKATAGTAPENNLQHNEYVVKENNSADPDSTAKSSTRKGESGKILAVAQQENLMEGLNSSERSVLESFNRTQEELKVQAAEKAKQEKILSDLKKEGKERSAEASKAKSRIGILQKQMERTTQKLIDYEDMASVKAVVEKVRPAVEQFMIAKRKAERSPNETKPLFC